MYKFFLFIVLLFAAGFFYHTAQAATAHPAGTLINIGGTVWRISDDETGRAAIDSAEKFHSNRFSFNNVVSGNSGDLGLKDNGFYSWGDGVLFNDGGTIYQVSRGKKNPFVSADVFLGQGFKFSSVWSGDLSTLPLGQAIDNPNSRHLPGTFLVNSSGAVYMQNSVSASALPSAEVFYSYGEGFWEVVSLNSTDSATLLTNPPSLNYRIGSLVSDAGVIWAIKQSNKVGFPTANCFLNFGFQFSMTLPGDTGSLNPAGTICAGVPEAPVSAYWTQSISTSNGVFKIEAASFNSATGKVRVFTDSATDRDCVTDCNVASLAAFVSANSGQSGMNGTYFCPTSYPDCAGKTNSFYAKIIDTNLKKQINATNGFGENFPFIAFDSAGFAKYYSQWIDYKNSGLMASAGVGYYGLVENGQVSLKLNLLDDKQKTLKGTQGALGLKGSSLYLIHVFGATVPDEAATLQAMGLDYAILLDGGGSTALMYQGTYKSGPGRNLANAIIVQELP